MAEGHEQQLDKELEDMWTKYTEENDEKFFRKFVKGFNAKSSLEKLSWEEFVRLKLDGNGEVKGPCLSTLPDELLPALSKFLFVAKDEAEQGVIQVSIVSEMTEIVTSLIVLCSHLENIPLVGSMAFVGQLTQTVTLLLQHLLHMESLFFKGQNKGQSKGQLRSEIMRFIESCCHFLELMYDPAMRWRAFLQGRPEPEEACPVVLHQEVVPFLYESFETALVDHFPQLGVEMLIVFGATISGSRLNALRSISPATSKMILKTVKSESAGPDVYLNAIYCTGKSVSVIHSTPIEERQLDIVSLIKQYQQILVCLSENLELVEVMPTVISMIPKMVAVNNSCELKMLMAKNEMIETLIRVLTASQASRLMPIVINCITLILKDCPAACDKMNSIKGYDKLFRVMNECGTPPDTDTLKAVMSMAIDGDNADSGDNVSRCRIRNIEPVLYLIEWIKDTDYEDHDQQVWLTGALHDLCISCLQNRMLCCQSEVIVAIINVLRTHHKLNQKTAIQLLKLLESLGSHSISPFELKQLISLLRDHQFPYKSHIIHIISSMAKGDGYTVCRNYFELPSGSQGLTVPNIRQWPGPVNGFSFHCWVSLHIITPTRIDSNVNCRP